MAVNILELIKNLFDLNNCIFVLAIDYGVVVKGLQSKFGKMTDENEWEFRAFFDKIIQLPFSMPISSYNISKYLQSLLVNVNYFKKSDLENEKILDKITEIVGLSVGTNPRALKRLANSVSLIEIIRGDQTITSEERVIEFALICIQIAYPIIYGLIQKESDFTAWDDQFVYTVLKNKKIDESDLATLKDSEEFDEEWEQNLWKICQVSSFLKQRVHLLSKLLNFIKENIPKVKDEEMSDTLIRLLSMSSVTSVSADSSSTASASRYKPRVKYGGWDDYKNILIDRKIPEFMIEHLNITLRDIENQFKDKAEITYAPSQINIKNVDAIGRTKVFVYIHITKKQIKLDFYNVDEKMKEKYVEGKYIERSGCFNILLAEDNNFSLTKYMPLVIEQFNKLAN